MKKDYFLIIDTETTQTDLVVDFGAVVCDKKGNVVAQCGVMVHDVFGNQEHPLFFDPTAPADSLWSEQSRVKRFAQYMRMVKSGSRMVASVSAINRWLDKVSAQFNPVLTAYNLAFDTAKCNNTGIDLNMFDRRFCLWSASVALFAETKAYREMVLKTHAFNPPTRHGNMTFKTNAETMARFVLNNPALEDEPHTALEDAIEYELPILVACLRRKPTRWFLSGLQGYNWKDWQVNQWFKA